MKNKTLKTFLAGTALALVSVLVCQLAPRPIWNVSYFRLAWIKTRIFSPRRTLDYAVIGTSHSWRAIDPGVLSDGLGGVTAWNLSRPEHGRDMDYFLLKELLRRHDVKNVLIPFVKLEKEELHPYASHFISPSEALAEAAFYLRKTPFSDGKKLRERIGLVAGHFANLSSRVYLRLVRGEKPLDPAFQEAVDRVDGYTIKAEEKGREEIRRTVRGPWRPRPGKDEPLPGDSRAGYYLERIGRLCAENGVKLHFVFMPFYGGTLPGKNRVAYLGRLGEVLLPDLADFADKSRWYDTMHLNREGGALFTRNLVALLKKGAAASPYQSFYADPGSPAGGTREN